MTKLAISKALSLPLSFVTSTHAILGKKRGGKSYKASVLAEEMLDADQQIVVVDPTSAWHGLRSSADGLRDGYPIAIFGGDHGDLPLEPEAGADLADAIVAERFSAILDTSDLTKGQEQRFLADFLERLYRKNKKSPLHLFLDEADLVAPQRPFGDEARTLGAAQSIVRRGGIKGIGVTMITQRPAELNKGVLSQIDQLTLLQLVSPPDLDAIENWVSRHDERGIAQEMLASLPSLPKGDAWIWAPAVDVFARITFRDRKTFDSGKTPEVGKKIAPPKKLAPIDLERLGEKMRGAVARQKESDPKALRAKITELEKQLVAKHVPPQAKPQAAPKIVEKPVLKDGQLARAEKIVESVEKTIEDVRGMFGGAITRLEQTADELRHAIRKVTKETMPGSSQVQTHVERLDKNTILWTPGQRARAPKVNGAHALGGGLRRILIALAQRSQGLTNRQIGIRAGLSSKSGSFATYLSRARSEGWIEDHGEIRQITEAGRAAIGVYDPLPTGPDLAQHWLRALGNSGAARILRALIDAYPSRLDNETIGDRAGLSAKSGSFATYMSKLRGLELVSGGRGETAASEELFE